MKDKPLYHLISSRDIPGVLQHGLTPRIGSNASSINEDRDAVFLCEEQDIEYWQIMLEDKTSVLAVDISDIPKSCIEKFEYSYYGEYAVKCPIPPAKITYSKQLDKTTPKYEKAMIDLCESHLISLSLFTQRCAEYYCGACLFKPDLGYITQDGLSMNIVMPRLNYDIRPQKYWENYLREYGMDGEYTFCDSYDNTPTKLYQKLVEYPDDESAKYRRFIYEYIDNAFPWAKTLDTGGWADYRAIIASKGDVYDE